MLTVKNYVRAKTVQEAYELCQKKSNVVLGGMLWLKMQNRNVNTAVDLCDLGLDKIIEEEDCFKIGAMVSLRQIETNKRLNEFAGGAFADAVKDIVGVQFRNMATVGGSIYGRFGFSDVLTLFQVLGAKVNLYNAGIMDICEFASMDRKIKDILTEIIIPKTDIKAVYLSQRNSATDFPVLSCAVSRINGVYNCSVGARPSAAGLFKDEKGFLNDGITEQSAEKFAEYVSENAVFGSNMRGGADYRKKVCAVLVRRALVKLGDK